MLIVLDTNIIFNNWLLHNPSIALIERFINLQQATLIIPEIVVQEVKNLYRRQLEEAKPKLKQLNGLRKAVGDPAIQVDVDVTVAKYERAFEARLEELKVERLTYDDIPHSRVVDRALRARRPFREQEKGYRDTLLWESVVRHAQQAEEPIFFITENSDDFADKQNKGQLHAHLLEDLRVAGLAADAVMLYHQIQLFAKAQIEPKLQRAEQILQALQQDRYGPFSIHQWVDVEQKELFVDDPGWLDAVLNTPPFNNLDEPTISQIEEIGELEVTDAKYIDQDRILIHARIDVTVLVDGFIEKSAYFLLDEDEQRMLEIMDNDWNEWVMWLQIVIPISVPLTLVFNLTDHEVDEYEIQPLPEVFGVCHICNAPNHRDTATSCGRCGVLL